MSIHASPAFPTMDDVILNINSVCMVNMPSGSQVRGIVCMMDEIKVEETLDWCPHTNSIIGLCHEHSQPAAHIFNNIDNTHIIFDDLAQRKVHLGTEVCQQSCST